MAEDLSRSIATDNSQRPSLTLLQEHILQLMTGEVDRAILLVGACGTSSSIDSHITYYFLNSAFDVLGRVQLILTKRNPTPVPLNHPRRLCLPIAEETTEKETETLSNVL